MAKLKIKKINEFDTKKLFVFGALKSKEVVIGVEGNSDKESMYVGIQLDKKDIKRVIKFLQKQIE